MYEEPNSLDFSQIRSVTVCFGVNVTNPRMAGQ